MVWYPQKEEPAPKEKLDEKKQSKIKKILNKILKRHD